MAVTLKPITKDNWRQLHRLSKSLSADQQRFVAPNTVSILEAIFEPETFTTYAIYEQDAVVGLLMTADEATTGRHWIARLMIGADYQDKGYGRAAMKLAIEMLKAKPDCHEVYISFEPENAVARGLYTSMGFIDTGTIEDEEVVYCLPLAHDGMR